MANPATLRYAGYSYLDRTAALQSGEVRPAGARLAMTVTPNLAQACDALLNGEADCAEIPLAALLDLSLDSQVVALPVFPNRGFCLRLLRGIRQAPGVQDLRGATIGVAESETTVGSWVRFTLETVSGADASEISWISGPAQEIAEFLAEGRVTAAVLPRTHWPAGPAMPFLRHAGDLDRLAYSRTGIFPILSVVALRRNVYERSRWLAASLTDAFAEAKALGEKRHRYWGALSVGLPWLMESIRDVDMNFGGDAYRYGLGQNRDALRQFASYARAGSSPAAEMTARFAPETVSHPGAPETSFYVVPLSHT